MKKQIWSLLLVLLAVAMLAGCNAIRENPAATTVPTLPENVPTFLSVSSYGYYIDDPRLPEAIREKLNAFGSIMLPEPSVQTQTHTDIPEAEHNAKGVDPVYVVLPDYDLSQFRGPYLWDDVQTGWEVCASYRLVAGMLTDELVKVYVDNDGNIRQYETVNLGRYEKLALDEGQIESACLHFQSAIQEHLGDVTREFYHSKQQHAPSAYRLFVDTEGNLILSTTAVLTDDAGTVELYAIIDGVKKQEAYVNITAQEAKEIMDTQDGYIILDVRNPDEFEASHIPGAVLLPLDEVEAKAHTLLPDKNQLLLVYCRSGRRSKLAAETLVELGYNNIKEFGGIIDWPYETQ